MKRTASCLRGATGADLPSGEGASAGLPAAATAAPPSTCTTGTRAPLGNQT